MVFVPAPGVYRAKVFQTLMGVQIMNTLAVWSSNAPQNDPNFAGLLAENVGLSWGSNMMPLLSNQLELRAVEVLYLGVESGATGVWGGAVGGGYTGQPMPANCAFCLTHTTGFSGRSNRGRTYVGGLTEDVCNGNFVLPAWGTAVLQAFKDTIADAFTTLDQNFCIVSTVSNGAPRTVASIGVVTNTITRDLRVDSMRTRLP